MKRYTLISLLMSVLVVYGPAQEKGLSPSLASLVEAERAFARTSVERGIRDSFLMFFADDGINFQPDPTNVRDSFQKRPPQLSPSPVTLNWEPVYADVSRAGDLGYTTGPYWLIDNSDPKIPTQHGYYFSIWKKQKTGPWRVVLDLGISTPAPATSQHLPFQAAPQTGPIRFSGRTSLAANKESLVEADRELLIEVRTEGAAAFLDDMSDGARLHRNGLMPMVGKEAIRSYLSQSTMVPSWEPLQCDVARSGDLGYTYGTYERKRGPAVAEKGYYVRVWKRNERGKWEVVLDITTTLPTQTSPRIH